MGIRKTVSICIPALNEEENVEAAVLNAIRAAEGAVDDYEIIIVDACSSDRTGDIADRLAAQLARVRVLHREEREGLGANYMYCVGAAEMNYFVMFPGDNENSWESLSHSFALIGGADIIIPYTLNQEVRAWHRRFISAAFVGFMNRLFGLDLRYYNGNAVYPTDMLRSLSVRSRDFAYNAEILVKLIKSGCSHMEFGIHIKPTGKTAIFGIRNIIGVLRTVAALYYDIRFAGTKGARSGGTAG